MHVCVHVHLGTYFGDYRTASKSQFSFPHVSAEDQTQVVNKVLSVPLPSEVSPQFILFIDFPGFFFSETEPHNSQTAFEFLVLLLLLCQCWDYEFPFLALFFVPNARVISSSSPTDPQDTIVHSQMFPVLCRLLSCHLPALTIPLVFFSMHIKSW